MMSCKLLVASVATLFAARFASCDPAGASAEDQTGAYFADILSYQHQLYNTAEKEYYERLANETRELEERERDSVEYDFIVVGAGSAGCALAHRLVESGHWNVLLLEAGKVENAITSIPLIAPALQGFDYNWKYLMEHESGIGAGLKNQRMSWPSGKALGGSSVISYNIYSRGNPEDYDAWGKRNPGWSYEDVLPYFFRSEDSRLHKADHRYHGEHGTISVDRSYQPKLTHAFIGAGGDLGYHKYVDYNSPRQVGFATMQGTLLHGSRYSAAKGYVFPILKHRNLDIVLKALVTRILIDPHTKQAYGVEYLKKGRKHLVFARKEVILSAGTFNSPKLLMLSGVGPKSHLEHHGIHVIKDLPVGEKLYDHIMYIGLLFKSKRRFSFSVPELLRPTTPLDPYGPFASLSVMDAVAFVNTNDTHAHNPNIELIVPSQGFPTVAGRIASVFFRISDYMYKLYFDAVAKYYTFSVHPILLHPKSHGSVRLHSADPYDPPLLRGHYFTDPHGEDMKTMIDAIRFAMKLADTDTFRHQDIHFHHATLPGCEDYYYDTDEYWECAIRTLSVTAYNQIGTNRMGPKDDPESVVDHELKVHGVKALRVVDASVIPVTLGAHMNAPAIMIGEKAADLIKHDWAKP